MTGVIRLAFGLVLIATAGARAAADPAQPASRAGDASRGAEFARNWCAGCHVIGSANRGTDAAPTFESIARDPTETPDRLRAFLARPHAPMPSLPLGRAEIDDLIAYLEQLSRQR